MESIKLLVPFIFWGGPGSLNKVIKHPSLNEIEVEYMVKWTRFLGIADVRYTDYLHEGGKSWLDLPVPDSDYRLHVRPFFVQEVSGVRPYFYFLGLFISPKDIHDLSQYENVIEAIDQKTLEEVKRAFEQGAPTIELNVQSLDKKTVEVPNTDDSIANVLKGSYVQVLRKFRIWMAQTGNRSFDEIAIACNPPKEDRIFDLIFLTDKFPHQRYSTFESEPPVPPLTNEVVKVYKGNNILISGAVLFGLLALSAYEIFQLTQEVKMKEKTIVETKQKLIDCDKLKNECKNELDKCSAAVSLRKGDAKKKRMLKM